LSVSIFLFGCGVQLQKKEPNDYSNTIINIYTSFNNEQQFYENYGNLILDHFPGIEINLMMPSDNSSGATKIDEHQTITPDLMFLYTDEYQRLSEQSYFMDLAPYVEKDKLDLDKYADSMIDALSTEMGSLYGLAPRVNIFGIFYNKDLFDQLHIDYPVSGMDWYELLNIASRFEGSTIGIESTFSASSWLMKITSTNKSYFIDPKSDSISFQKEEWTTAIQRIIELYQTETVLSNKDNQFIQGKAALLLEGSVQFIDELHRNANFSWGFVPEPVNSKKRDESRSVFFDQVLSIPEKSADKELAWQILKMLMDEQVADEYNSFPRSVSTLKSHMNQYSGVSLEEFWQQNLDINPGILPSVLSSSFIGEFYGTLEKELQLAIDGKQSADQTFEKLVNQIQIAYEKEKLRRNE
jgi:multiple sugar transport system substrate-binding protein